MKDFQTEAGATFANGVTLTGGGVLRGARGLLPVALFVVPFGVSFGVTAAEHGMTPEQAIWMSLLAFSGVAQFASLDFLSPSVPFLSLALVALAVNARHVVMGAVLSPWINALPPGRRMLTLLFMTDPNFADSYAAFLNGKRDMGRLLGGGLALWAMWTLGTAIGVLGGKALGSLDAYGVDVVMLCFFTALVAGQAKASRYWAPVALSCAAAVLLQGHLPQGWDILVAALVGGVVMAVSGGRDIAGRTR
ncbi:AzlC family ABC transporter permease [Marivibrio halodurans]|uniref:AzlC family ABC transporter permease n=1 Tax=Marivibrio halodurans TaxID=2039722 RepID=A0A8J7V423_9PROT|nr:AzlC family ABC transporter permease [Marivibrio halodurans]MBP5857224.1 AzlC family ABC transporter permease [Marivibrio halodurans]